MLFYFLAVALLAVWPWNVWLIAIGAAYACRLQCWDVCRLRSAGPSDPLIGAAQRIHEAIVAGDDLDAAHELARVLRREELGHLPGNVLIDVTAARR